VRKIIESAWEDKSLLKNKETKQDIYSVIRLQSTSTIGEWSGTITLKVVAIHNRV